MIIRRTRAKTLCRMAGLVGTIDAEPNNREAIGQ